MKIGDSISLRWLVVVLLHAAISFFGVEARADAIDPPREDCPEGSRGESCHGGPYCAPASACVDDSSCAEGETCQELDLCIGRIDCAGGWTPGEHFWEDTVTGTCSGGSCSSGSCETRRVCVEGEDSLRAGCRCQNASSLRAGGALLIALVPALMMLGFRRGRRRPRSEDRP